MLFNLFGKKDEAADDHIFTDKAYVSTNAKMNACAALARADAGAVFICWFPQTAQKFKDFFRQQGLDENRVWETLHVHTSKLAGKNPVFVEHYPLHGKEIELIKNWDKEKITVLVIEHNIDVIKVADHIIDIGPEGGDGGGQILFEGTPEALVKVTESFTAKFLKAELN